MSVITRKRLYVTVVAALLATTAAFANNPSPRLEVRMVYDPSTTTSILFGGRSAVDYGTAVSYYTNETWVWNGTRWAQRFPDHSPSPRSAQSMAFDTARSRVVLFGGRENDKDVVGDTWVYENNDWRELHPASAPTARQIAGLAYDPLRDRVVLFGGTNLNAAGTAVETRFDMWEFDGTTWHQVMAEGPKVNKPMLVWDGVRHQMIMMGVDADAKTVMYVYDPAAVKWNEVKPAALPPCANEASLVYMEKDGLIALLGGLCLGTYDEAWYYDGVSWYGFNSGATIGHVFGHAVTYDARRDEIVIYGGMEEGLPPRGFTYTYNGGRWSLRTEVVRPGPRAATSFASDPFNKAIWMFGGLNENADGYFNDFWKYQNGNWALIEPKENSPTGCGAVSSAVDTDRAKLVVLCEGSIVHEFDLEEFTWKKFPDLKTTPTVRRLGHLAYDPVLKKSVYYGGFDTTGYKNDSWLWDGTAWTEVKKGRADARSNGMMWFDPSLKKVVLYGGIGRPQAENTIRRYSDMWSFDATNGWTKMTVTATPGERYDARVLVDPHTNKVMLFGGIRVDQVDEKIRKQVFGDDLWEWNGTTWTKVTNTNLLPSARQSFGLAYDGYADRFVLFSGYNGLFLSDVWSSPNWLTWEPREESLVRRRVIRR